MQFALALLALATSASLGVGIGDRIRHAAGDSPAGRFGATWAAWAGWLFGLGAALAAGFEGRLPERFGLGTWSYFGWREAAFYGGVLSFVAAAAHWALAEWRDGRDELDAPAVSGAVPEFPPALVQEILAAEPRAAPELRRRTAERLAARAERTGQPLPEELAAFVRRHGGHTAD